MNLVLLRTLFVLVFFINLTHYFVEGDGMIEVFGWKQMDFYNRGGSENVQIPNRGGGSTKRPLNREPGGVVFPDQLPHKRHYRRSSEVFTSRDYPASTGASNRYNKNNNDGNNSTSYIPYNNVPMGATHFNGRLFITMPRRRLGIPSTLNYVDMRKDSKNPSPKLYAYPNFDTNYLNPDLRGDPNRLISVYRTTVDACKRLWFIDTGMLELPDNRMQVKRPSIWIIDLTTDRVLQRFDIPEAIVDTGRGLASITIDVNSKNCGQAFAYIPDLVNSALFVYSLGLNRMWAFSHNYFNFDPLGGDLNVGGQSFRWDDGIFSITLGPQEPNGYRTVYFHAMASNNEFFVNSEVLQNESNADRSDHGSDFQLLGSRGTNHQSTMHEYDPRTNTIFYDEIQRNGVGCWNRNKPFSAENHGTVAQDPDRMIYPSDLTIDDDGTIWIMTNSMPIFIYSNLDTNVVNFRVWKQNVFEAAKNTVCE